MEVALRRVAGSMALLAVIVGSGFWWTRSSAPKDDPKLFANRVWAERVRRDDRDMVLYFIPVEVGSKRGGSMQRSSRYAFGGELFTWTRDGNTKVNLSLPQRQRTVKVGVRTWACPDTAPKGFELCMELSDGKEKVLMYSRKGWKVPKGEELPTPVFEVPELPAECVDCEPGGLESLFLR